jgi:hypothetical protein
MGGVGKYSGHLLEYSITFVVLLARVLMFLFSPASTAFWWMERGKKGAQQQDRGGIPRFQTGQHSIYDQAWMRSVT